MLRCEVLPLAAFAEVAADWAVLAARCSHAPFLELDFVEPLLAVFADGSQRVVRVRDARGVLAVGVFARRGAMWETFQPSQIPIGCMVARADADWAQLLAAIARAMPGLVAGVSATQQDPQFLQRARDGGAVSTLDYITTAWVEVGGSFEDYWNARGKNLRQNLRKQRRKLADDAVALQLDVVTEPAGMAEALADYGRLESAGWKAEGGTAIAVDNDQGRFYGSMLERFCARGRARVYRYRFDRRVVVVDLCIESADTLVVLKTTYDESIRSLSPASLMREEVFRQIWEQGRIRRIEFYGRMMDWHTRWSADSRTLYHVNWYRWPRMMRTAQRLTALSKAASSAARVRRELSSAASAEATAAAR